MILDTHVAIWTYEDREMTREARREISRAAARGQLYISAISAWEIATLVRTHRLRIGTAVEAYVRGLLDLPGAHEAKVTSEIARVAGELESLHGDPADRIIVATAAVSGESLATRDERILNFANRHGGFSCVAA